MVNVDVTWDKCIDFELDNYWVWVYYLWSLFKR